MGQSDWLQNSNKFERLLNLTLSLIHPELFKCGLEILQKLRVSRQTMEIANKWQSVYTGIAIISNRITPRHRDTKGKPEWFDLLMNYAGSDANPKLLIRDLGLELQYSSGTVVCLCGMILEHEVGCWGNGDRVCYAHFMRESVRKHLQARDPGWVYQSTYLSEKL
jgi:Oxygenase domain of the 2OGFeDO superfamily